MSAIERIILKGNYWGGTGEGKKAFLATDQNAKYFYTNEGGVLGGALARSFGGCCV